MIPIQESVLKNNSRIIIASPSYYLIGELFIGILISALIGIWKVFKSLFLSKSLSRDLTDATVLITGVTTSLGRCLAEEFARVGCKIICIDNDLEIVRKIACELDCYSNINKLCKLHMAYECNLFNRNSIKNTAKRIKNDVNQIDILITCTSYYGENKFDRVSKTLMSHYWTVVAFLPSMIKHKNKKAYVVGVTPTTSTKDANMGTRAAIGGLMESLVRQFDCCSSSSSSNNNGQINFITIAPNADPRLIEQSEKNIAFNLVQGIKKNQCYLSWWYRWWSAMISNCVIRQDIIQIFR